MPASSVCSLYNRETEGSTVFRKPKALGYGSKGATRGLGVSIHWSRCHPTGSKQHCIINVDNGH